MKSLPIENIIRFVVVILLQVLLVNNMQFLGICNPCIYILALLALPVTLPRWAELLIGFATGLVMDIFCDSLGAHTAACTLISYIRPLLISRLVQDNDRLTGTPDGDSLGIATYARYVALLTAIHHIVLFSLLAFSWHNWWLTLLQIVFSTAVSIALILGWDLLIRR